MLHGKQRMKPLLLATSLVSTPLLAEPGLAIYTVYIADFKPARVKVVTDESEQIGGGISKMIVLSALLDNIHDPILIAASKPGSALYGVCMEPDQPAEKGKTYTYAVQQASYGAVYQGTSMGHTSSRRVEQMLESPTFSTYSDAGALYEVASLEQRTAIQAMVYESSLEPNYRSPADFNSGKVRILPLSDVDLGSYLAVATKVRTLTNKRHSYIFSHRSAQDFFVWTTHTGHGGPRHTTHSVNEPPAWLLLLVGLCTLYATKIVLNWARNKK